MNGILPNFQAGARCWLLGEGGGLCDKAFWRGALTCSSLCVADTLMLMLVYDVMLCAVTIYLIANISYNTSLMFVLKWGSAALMVVAGAVIMPMSNVVYTLPAIMGEQATQIGPTDIAALILVVYGMTLFKVAMPQVSVRLSLSLCVRVCIRIRVRRSLISRFSLLASCFSFACSLARWLWFASGS